MQSKPYVQVKETSAKVYENVNPKIKPNDKYKSPEFQNMFNFSEQVADLIEP